MSIKWKREKKTNDYINKKAALAAYTFSKDYTMNRLRTYTKDNSVTSSGGHQEQEVPKEGAPLRRSVNRSLWE